MKITNLLLSTAFLITATCATDPEGQYPLGSQENSDEGSGEEQVPKQPGISIESLLVKQATGKKRPLVVPKEDQTTSKKRKLNDEGKRNKDEGKHNKSPQVTPNNGSGFESISKVNPDEDPYFESISKVKRNKGSVFESIRNVTPNNGSGFESISKVNPNEGSGFETIRKVNPNKCLSDESINSFLKTPENTPMSIDGVLPPSAPDYDNMNSQELIDRVKNEEDDQAKKILMKMICTNLVQKEELKQIPYKDLFNLKNLSDLSDHELVTLLKICYVQQDKEQDFLFKIAKKILIRATFQSSTTPLLQWGLGYMYEYGIGGIPINFNIALECYKKAAEQNHIQAQYDTGRLYEVWEGKVNKALKWYKKAGNQGHIQAQYKMGCLYEDKDEDNLALKWYEQAANQGHIQAQYKMGCLYEDKDEDNLALKWYEQAANQGHVNAQYRLGYLYIEGDLNSCPDNAPEQARQWFLKAAKQNHEEAQYDLAKMYKTGEGGEKSLTKALKWYTISRFNQYDHESSYLKVFFTIPESINFTLPLLPESTMLLVEDLKEKFRRLDQDANRCFGGSDENLHLLEVSKKIMYLSSDFHNFLDNINEPGILTTYLPNPSQQLDDQLLKMMEDLEKRVIKIDGVKFFSFIEDLSGLSEIKDLQTTINDLYEIYTDISKFIKELYKKDEQKWSELIEGRLIMDIQIAYPYHYHFYNSFFQGFSEMDDTRKKDQLDKVQEHIGKRITALSNCQNLQGDFMTILNMTKDYLNQCFLHYFNGYGNTSQLKQLKSPE
jgi:TPR repeat protein